MWLFDANILIYAFRPASPFHKTCDQWLQNVLHRGDAFFLAELVELAFLRLNTLPLSNQTVPTFAECWRFLAFLRKALGCHRARIGERHATIFQALCHDLKLSGNDLNDAYVMIIGAMKCGTSSLYEYLIEHPQICPCAIKEPEFFSACQPHGYDANGRRVKDHIARYDDLWAFDAARHRYALEASTGHKISRRGARPQRNTRLWYCPSVHLHGKGPLRAHRISV